MSAEVSTDGALSAENAPVKNLKSNRYYYRHREEILEKKRLQRMENPEYRAKLEAKKAEKKAADDARIAKEEIKKAKLAEKLTKVVEREQQRIAKVREREIAEEAKKEERRRAKATELGVAIPSGKNNPSKICD